MARRNHRLEAARSAGYLDAAGKRAELLKREYTMWCWRLRLPVVWCERKSPRSKYGRVVLDLFTTPHRLTREGESELERLAVAGAMATISPGDAVWEDVPLAQMDDLARAVFRVATRQESYEVVKRPPPAEIVTMLQVIGDRVSLEKSA